MPVKHPFWTEIEAGWSAGPYRIERVAPALWFLIWEDALGTLVVDSASTPHELLASLRPGLTLRGIWMLLILGASLCALVMGSLVGSVVVVVAASLASYLSVMKLSDYLIEPDLASPRASV